MIEHGASVNQLDGQSNLPLHLALLHDNSKLALSLIEHGASVNHKDTFGDVPIAYCIKRNSKPFNNELFKRLIPKRRMDSLKIICRLSHSQHGTEPDDTEHSTEVLFWKLSQLIQYLVLIEPLSVTIKTDIVYANMVLNGHYINSNVHSLKAVCLCSVLLILMGSDVCDAENVRVLAPAYASIEDKYHVKAINKLWSAYCQKCTAKKLQTLCIKKTRQSMISLTDEHFQSLPVPSRIRRSLMLHDVADVLCEAYQKWPKCMPIEDLM